MPPVLPAGAPGPISATAIPSTIMLIKSPSPSFKGLGERIHNRLPPKWLQYKHPLQEFLKALEDTVIEQHSLWEVSSMVVGDTFTATGAAITGSGSGKSLGTGKII
jgi:hypothetical protein